MSDYTDLINLSWDELPKDKLLPEGSYLLRGEKVTYIGKKEGDEKSTPRFLFIYGVKEAMDDVDPEKLVALNDNGVDYDLTTKQVFHTIWIRRPKDFDKVREHFRVLGVEPEGNIQETLKQFTGREVVGFLEQQSYVSKDGETITDNVPVSFVELG